MDLSKLSQGFNILNASQNTKMAKVKKVASIKKTQRPVEKRQADALAVLYSKFCKDLDNIQGFLFCITQPGPKSTQIRADLLSGTRGAMMMTKLELEMLDTLQRRISRGRGTAKMFFLDQLEDPEFKKASLVLRKLMEGQNSIIPGTNLTYRFAKSLIATIVKSEYFERMRKETTDVANQQEEDEIASTSSQLDPVSQLVKSNPSFD